MTPNLTFGQQAQGGKGAGVIYIRGVGQADTLATYDRRSASTSTACISGACRATIWT